MLNERQNNVLVTRMFMTVYFMHFSLYCHWHSSILIVASYQKKGLVARSIYYNKWQQFNVRQKYMVLWNFCHILVLYNFYHIKEL